MLHHNFVTLSKGYTGIKAHFVGYIAIGVKAHFSVGFMVISFSVMQTKHWLASESVFTPRHHSVEYQA